MREIPQRNGAKHLGPREIKKQEREEERGFEKQHVLNAHMPCVCLYSLFLAFTAVGIDVERTQSGLMICETAFRVKG